MGRCDCRIIPRKVCRAVEVCAWAVRREFHSPMAFPSLATTVCSYKRFARAVLRARQVRDTDSKIRTSERLLRLLGENAGKYVSRFPVRTGTRIQVILADDIEWIAAAGDYAELHCGGRHHLLRETMNSLEQKLDPAKFLRIHRSRIVRLTCVRELHTIDNREYLVRLSDGSEHRSSRSYADRLADWLSPKKI